MNPSISLGRLAGIPVGVHWSWLLIFALIAWSLAAGVFPNENPGLSDGTYAGMGVAAAVLFFGSILLHELGHAIQARRERVEIEGITLWLFGGVARFRGMYESPGAEFRIAIAGPLVTLAIAAVLLLLTAVVDLPEAVDGVASWLAYINGVLLIFNLLPALPLDGGRVLHAALWRARRSLVWATRVGTAIGIGFGYLLIGGGVVLLFAGAGFGGLWFALIGWFLASAARGEAQALLAREALGDMPVRELMAHDPAAVDPETTLDRFIDELARHTRYTTYPVVEGGRPVGLLTFARVAATPRELWARTRVAECMVPLARVPVVGPGDPASEALLKIAASEVGRALVVADGRLVGLLSISDLARAIAIAGPTPAFSPWDPTTRA
ncbi:MAG TPA: site-2 protease family protein [Solirubrobacterales bacterium]